MTFEARPANSTAADEAGRKATTPNAVPAKALSRRTIALHWLLALAMIAMSGAGLYMANFEVWALYPIHKSIGILILLPALLRAVWRLREGWPAALGHSSALQQRAAQAVHWMLLLSTLAMPLSGMMYSGASGHGFGIFGLQLLPEQPDPGRPGEVLPLHAGLSDLAQNLHSLFGYLLIAALLLHVAGALKHQLLDRDGTLSRMLGR